MFISTFSFAQWDHSACRATSMDGISWTRDTTLLIYPASVPKAVIDTNGVIHMYYIYMKDQNSMETIRTASSTDGKNFSTPQQITVTNNVTLNRFDPKPVLLSDGSIRIYYVDATLLPPHDVYSAVSTDGINFTEQTGKCFEYSELTDPDVFKADSNWYLYAPSPSGMICGISTDEGVSFTQDTSFNWNSASVFGTYKFENGVYRTYYCKNGDIVSASSTDGFNLVEDTGIVIKAFANETLCDPSVVKLNGEYILYFKSQGYYTVSNINNVNVPKIEMYPNPLTKNDQLHVNLSSPGNYVLEIYNSLGKIILNKSFYSQTNVLDIKQLKAGIYFYMLRNESKTVYTNGKLEVY